LASALLLVTVAGEDGEARILGEAGIGVREVAEDENGFAVRRDAARVNAVSAKTGRTGMTHGSLFLVHPRSISRDGAFTKAGEQWIGTWATLDISNTNLM